MNISAINFKELTEKYKGINIGKIVEGWLKSFEKKPFKKKQKKIWNDIIKDNIIFENLDWKKPKEEKEIATDLKEEKSNHTEEELKKEVKPLLKKIIEI